MASRCARLQARSRTLDVICRTARLYAYNQLLNVDLTISARICASVIDGQTSGRSQPSLNQVYGIRFRGHTPETPRYLPTDQLPMGMMRRQAIALLNNLQTETTEGPDFRPAAGRHQQRADNPYQETAAAK
jgi:hypothetical protein